MLESFGMGYLVTFILKSLLKHAANTPPKTDSMTGDKILSHSWGFRAIPISCFAVAIMIVCISTVASPWDDNVETISFLLSMAFFLLFGFFLMTQGFMYRVYISNEGINVNTPTRSHKIRREDIYSITFSLSNQAFVITTDNGEKSKVYTFVNGIKYLVDCFEKYLPPEVYPQAKREFDIIKSRVKTGASSKKP